MITPYGFLPGTHRVTKTGHEVDVVELIGDLVTIVWQDTGEQAVIFKKDLAHMTRKDGPPHGLNSGTYRLIGDDGPRVRVALYFSPRLVKVDTGVVNPASLRPIGSTE